MIRVDELHLSASLRECWVQADNFRISFSSPTWSDKPTIHSIAVESVQVDVAHRNQGIFSAFIKRLCADQRYDMVIVEGVGNPLLAQALQRWGWAFDDGVMDFYWRRENR
jgi:hypothetical protein